MSKRIVITGLGVYSPIGCDRDTFWQSLCSGRSGAKPVSGMDTTELTRDVACQIAEPLAATTIPTPGRASRLAVLAASDALKHARLPNRLDSTHRPFVAIGTTMGETELIEARLAELDERWLDADHAEQIIAGQPGCISRSVCDSCAATGRHLDVYGACAAGNMAIALAAQSLRDGACDVALAGGADGFSRLAFIGFMRLRLTAAQCCRPFDERRDGLFVGEGATVFVLERERDARARGAVPLAAVAGWGMTSESHHPTRPDPEGAGLTRAVTEALRSADLPAADLDYVNAHGTGTPQNDMIEVKVMNRTLEPGTPFSSTKAITGHMMGAAGAGEAAVCLLSILNQTIVPTWNLDKVLEPCDMDAVMGAPRSACVRAVLNNSAGFGGYNSSIILTAA